MAGIVPMKLFSLTSSSRRYMKGEANTAGSGSTSSGSRRPVKRFVDRYRARRAVSWIKDELIGPSNRLLISFKLVSEVSVHRVAGNCPLK